MTGENLSGQDAKNIVSVWKNKRVLRGNFKMFLNYAKKNKDFKRKLGSMYLPEKFQFSSPICILPNRYVALSWGASRQRKTYFEYIHIEPNWPLILGFDLPFLWVQSSKTRGPILGSTQCTNLFISPCQTAIYEKIPADFLVLAVPRFK